MVEAGWERGAMRSNMQAKGPGKKRDGSDEAVVGIRSIARRVGSVRQSHQPLVGAARFMMPAVRGVGSSTRNQDPPQRHRDTEKGRMALRATRIRFLLSVSVPLW
jgi:hypothetical protein